MEKSCSICKEVKDYSNFSPDKRTKTGLYSNCKKCHQETYVKAWSGMTPEQKLRSHKYRKEWRIRNVERVRAYTRTYNRKWLKTPAGKQYNLRLYFRRRTLMKNRICDITIKDWQEILVSQDNKCLMCNMYFDENRKPTQDHIIPVSKGGHHTKTNIQALCMRCNIFKGDKILKLKGSSI